jgi:serine/threonine protein kinase
MSGTVDQPRVFASFELLAKAGQGGMGTVYQARRVGQQDIVALKIASRRVADDPILQARFQHECTFSCRFQHAHLVRSLEHGIADGLPYLVMEFVPGQPLSKIIKERGSLPEREAVNLISQVGEALTYLHEHQFVHRDVKPENILVTPDGQAKLADLGLIKDLDSLSRLTKMGTGLGTFEYSAPEQYDDAKSAEPRSDVYSLAATLYATLTGTFPFGSGGHVKILKRKLGNAFVAPAEIKPDLSEAVNNAICRGLNARHEDRPATVAEFTALLEVRDRGAAGGAEGPNRKLAKHDERRVALRFEVQLDTSCEPVLQTAPELGHANVQDVSTTGLCLRVHRRFEVGTLLRVGLQGLPPETSLRRLARIRWVQQLEANAWLIGCALSRPLTDIELESMCFEGSCKTHVD